MKTIQPQDAISSYNKAIELKQMADKNSCTELYETAIRYFDNAMILCDKITEKDFRMIILEDRYFCRLALAKVLFDNKKYGAALNQYRWSQSFNDKNPVVWFNMANCYIYQELYQDATNALINAFEFIDKTKQESHVLIKQILKLLMVISDTYLSNITVVENMTINRNQHKSVRFSSNVIDHNELQDMSFKMQEAWQSLRTVRYLLDSLLQYTSNISLHDENGLLREKIIRLIKYKRSLLPHQITNRNQARKILDINLLENSDLTKIAEHSSLPSIDTLVNMTHDDAIDEFNASIGQGVLWPLDHLALVIKKFQNERIGHINEAELLFYTLMGYYHDASNEECQSLVTEMMEVYKRRCLVVNNPDNEQIKINKQWMELLELYYLLNPSTYTLNALAVASKMIGDYKIALSLYIEQPYQHIKLDEFSFEVIVDITLNTKGLKPLIDCLNNNHLDLDLFQLPQTLLDRFPFTNGLPYSYQLKVLIAVLGVNDVGVEDKLKYLNKVFSGIKYQDGAARYLIRDFLSKNQLKEAFEIYNKIETPSEPTHQILIVALVKHQYYRAALELLDIAMTHPFNHFKPNRFEITNNACILNLHSFYVKGGGCPGYKGLSIEVAYVMIIALMRAIKSLKNQDTLSVTIITGKGDGHGNQKSPLRQSVEGFLTTYFENIGRICDIKSNPGCFELRLNKDDFKKLSKKELVSHRELSLADIKDNPKKSMVSGNPNSLHKSTSSNWREKKQDTSSSTPNRWR